MGQTKCCPNDGSLFARSSRSLQRENGFAGVRRQPCLFQIFFCLRVSSDNPAASPTLHVTNWGHDSSSRSLIGNYPRSLLIWHLIDLRDLPLQPWARETEAAFSEDSLDGAAAQNGPYLLITTLLSWPGSTVPAFMPASCESNARRQSAMDIRRTGSGSKLRSVPGARTRTSWPLP